jgi:SPP1 gp7 family putative phage head morphogenesis protein
MADPLDNLPAPEIICEPVQPEAALAFWAWKAAMPYHEVQKLAFSARDRAFYTAGLAAQDMVQTVKDALGEALKNGETLKDFQERIAEVLAITGWQGRRLETIFRNNLQTAYSAGRYAKLQEVKKIRPYWQYITVGDEKVRPSHAILSGKVFPADHEFWEENYPPNGHRCRCGVRSLSARQMTKEGLEPETKMPGPGMYVDKQNGDWETYVAKPGADVGWQSNPGKTWLSDPTAGLPGVKPQKEILTQKKLGEQISNLEARIKAESDSQALAALEAQKARLQEILDKRRQTAEKKKLVREQKRLEAELAGLEVKTYSGIWQQDITTADWLAKSASIQAKKDYFQDKLQDSGLPEAELQKFTQLLQELDEFAVEGKRYHDVQSALDKVRNNLTALKNGGVIPEDDPFSAERKAAALWAKNPQEADDALREVCGQVWQNASPAEREAIYEYTRGSGSFNRPLRGYEGSWYTSKGIGKVDLNYEGRAEAIRHLTSLINKSSYTTDIWLQRGLESTRGAAAFLGISEKDLQKWTQSQLEKALLRERITEDAFASCGSAKGKGFSGYIFNIYCPKGTRMMYAEPFSHYGDGAKLTWDGKTKQSNFGSEDETIIQRGTTFKIIRVEKRSGNTYFDLEVVDQIGEGAE